jgi:hypothetical protein
MKPAVIHTAGWLSSDLDEIIVASECRGPAGNGVLGVAGNLRPTTGGLRTPGRSHVAGQKPKQPDGGGQAHEMNQQSCECITEEESGGTEPLERTFGGEMWQLGVASVGKIDRTAHSQWRIANSQLL